jgi:hypothetical protein
VRKLDQRFEGRRQEFLIDAFAGIANLDFDGLRTGGVTGDAN